jgi:hypothetical protein
MLTSLATLVGAAALMFPGEPPMEDFAIPWYTIDCGGGTSSSELFALSGTIGQFDANPANQVLGNSRFTIAGGFWPGVDSRLCAADFNADGRLNPDDLSDMITCFFVELQFPGTCPAADFNADGLKDPEDLSDYITAFFFGC